VPKVEGGGNLKSELGTLFSVGCTTSYEEGAKKGHFKCRGRDGRKVVRRERKLL